MRRFMLVGVLLAAGCQGLVGPRQRRDMPERPDNPNLTIAEQEQRGRELLAFPDPSPAVGPRTWTSPPDSGRNGR